VKTYSLRRMRRAVAFKGVPKALPGFGIERLEDRQLFAAVTFPSSPGLEFQTNGPSRPPSIGDWYTTAASASVDRAHYALIEVTADMLTAGGGTVTITVNDAESSAGAGPLDEVQGTEDPTRFRLLSSDRVTPLFSTTVASGSANATAVTFSVTAVGTYFVESVTGALPLSGDATADLNDDDNAYTITISQSGGLLGQYQAAFQQTALGDRDLFFVVGPGTTSLFLRIFHHAAATVTYTRPSGATIAGTASADGLWNGPSPTLNTGGDTISGLTSADVGIWKVTLGGLAPGNQTIFEPNDGDGRRIVILDSAPQGAGNFAIAAGSPLATAINVPADHPFTVRNGFATSDTINLSTSGTATGFTAALLDGNGTPLTDSTGDGVVDTGLIAPGATANFILRVTPTTPTATSDTTTLSGSSFLDEQVNSGASITRSASIVTTQAAVPAIERAIIDYGFLRSRNGTLTGSIAAGDPGTHRVRVNWGDGTTSFIDLADGQTNFSVDHRYQHGGRRPVPTLTVVNESGNRSAPFKALTRSKALVIQTFQDALGRDPTAKELQNNARQFDKCRSASSLREQAAELARRLEARGV